MPVSDAIRAIHDIRISRAFEATFKNTRTAFEGKDIQVPVTVAFGDCDWILTSSAQRRDKLPPNTRWLKKTSWGHVPMWIDPRGVSRLILDGTNLEPSVLQSAEVLSI